MSDAQEVSATARVVTIEVNGEPRQVAVEPRILLVHLLREHLGLTGTHVGCVVGRCGACTVLLDGLPVKSCMVFGVQADGAKVTTIEGLAEDDELHALQYAFWDEDAAECGYCTPGMIMAAAPLIARDEPATDEEIRTAISGNLCRCTGYDNIVSAIRSAAGDVPGSRTIGGVVSDRHNPES